MVDSLKCLLIKKKDDKFESLDMVQVLLLQSKPFVWVTSKYLGSCRSYRKTKIILSCQTKQLLLNKVVEGAIN